MAKKKATKKKAVKRTKSSPKRAPRKKPATLSDEAEAKLITIRELTKMGKSPKEIAFSNLSLSAPVLLEMIQHLLKRK